MSKPEIGIPISELSEWTGFSLTELRTLTQHKHIPSSGPDGYPLETTVRALFRYLRTEIKDALPRQFESMAACEAQTGIPKSVLSSAKVRAPGVFTAHRINLIALLHWVFSGDVDVEDFQDDKKLMMRWKQLREKVALDKDLSSVIPRADVQSALNRGLSLMFNALERQFAYELPPVLKGSDETAIQAKLLAAVETFKAVLRAELGKLAQESVNKAPQSTVKDSSKRKHPTTKTAELSTNQAQT